MATLGREELYWFTKVMASANVEALYVPEVQPDTELASLLEGLPTEFGIGITEEEDSKKILYYLTESLEVRRLLSQFFDMVHKESPDLAVKIINFREGSLLMTVFLGADGWIRSNIGADYDPLAPISTYLKSPDALHQLNTDFWRAAKVIVDNFADCFQNTANP